MAVCLAALNCGYDRNNPIDPGAENYVGDDIANDITPPLLTIITPPLTQNGVNTVDFDSAVFIGTAMDAHTGIDAVLVNGLQAFIDSQWVHQGQFAVSWRLTLYLTSDTTAVTVTARDKSFHENSTSLSRTIVRLRTPLAPTNARTSLQGTSIRVAWNDESRNETSFVIQRKTGSDGQYDEIGQANANDTSFIDNGPFTANAVYYYQVIASNAVGSSAPSSFAVVVYSATAADNLPPVIVFQQPVNAETIHSTIVEVVLSITDVSGVNESSVRVNNIPATRSGSSYRCNISLTHGQTITLVATATDNSVNANTATESISVTCDTSAADTRGPVIAFVSPVDNDTVQTSVISVVISVSDASGVSTVRLNGIPMTVGGTTGQFVADNTVLEPGMNALVIDALDYVGNTSYDTLHVYYDPAGIDQTPPSLTLYGPQNNITIGDSIVLVNGTALDNSGIWSVTVNGLPAALDSLPKWSIMLPLAHGHNDIVIIATDASPNRNDTNLTVRVTQNRIPAITPIPDTNIVVGTTYDREIHAWDPDNDELIFEILQPTTGATMDYTYTVPRIKFTPTAIGQVEMRVRVRDTYNGERSITWKVNVGNTGNQPPLFTLKPNDTTVYVLDSYVAEVRGTDPEGDPIVYVCTQLPGSGAAWFNIVGGATLQWTPPVGLTGTFLTIVELQSNGHIVPASWNITVIERPNRAPVIQQLSDTTLPAGSYLTRHLTVTDPDGDSVVWHSSNLVGSWVTSLSGNQFNYSWDATTISQGIYDAIIVFRDERTSFLLDTMTFKITLTGDNQPPQFAGHVDTAFTDEGRAFIDTIPVSDLDNDIITIDHIPDKPNAMNVSMTMSGGGPAVALRWTPFATDIGTHRVRIVIKDGRGGYDTLDFAIVVRPAQAFWHSFSDTLPDVLDAASLAATPSWVYVGVNNGRVFRRPADNSAGWQQVGTNPPMTQTVSILAVQPQNEAVYIGTKQQAGMGPWYYSGTSWVDVKGQVSYPQRDIAVIYDKVFVTQSIGGYPVLRSVNLQPFSERAGSLPAQAYAIAADQGANQDLFVSTVDKKIYCDPGNNNNWQEAFTGTFQDTVRHLAVFSGAGPVLAAVRNDGIHIAQRTSPLSYTFQKISILPSSSGCFDLLASDNADSVGLAAFDNGTVWASTDRGQTWFATGGLPGSSVARALAYTGKVFYVLMNDKRVYRHMHF